jgi:hypothetical protein
VQVIWLTLNTGKMLTRSAEIWFIACMWKEQNYSWSKKLMSVMFLYIYETLRPVIRALFLIFKITYYNDFYPFSKSRIFRRFKIRTEQNMQIYIYVWKLNQPALELDFRAVNFLFFPRRDLNSHHWYTAAPFA